MKTDRLIGILSVLLQKDTATAPELADRFEVSRRTINRDIETLCQAGIPLVTRQGAGGGISIAENYKIDRTLLTKADMQDILAGLRSLDSVQGTNRCELLMEKLLPDSYRFLAGGQSVLIDLASWYKTSLAPKIEQVRAAIDSHRVLRFLYYAPGGESERSIEPYYLIFRWSSWYVWGFCRLREDFRLFKLNRTDKLQATDAFFTPRPVPLPDLRNERIFPGGIRVKALFEPECRWRLIEEFGVGSFEEQPDGRLLFCADYTDPENLLSWLMTFREKARLLEPTCLRDALCLSLKNTLKQYEEDFV